MSVNSSTSLSLSRTQSETVPLQQPGFSKVKPELGRCSCPERIDNRKKKHGIGVSCQKISSEENQAADADNISAFYPSKEDNAGLATESKSLLKKFRASPPFVTGEGIKSLKTFESNKPDPIGYTDVDELMGCIDRQNRPEAKIVHELGAALYTNGRNKDTTDFTIWLGVICMLDPTCVFMLAAMIYYCAKVGAYNRQIPIPSNVIINSLTSAILDQQQKLQAAVQNNLSRMNDVKKALHDHFKHNHFMSNDVGDKANSEAQLHVKKLLENCNKALGNKEADLNADNSNRILTRMLAHLGLLNQLDEKPIQATLKNNYAAIFGEKFAALPAESAAEDSEDGDLQPTQQAVVDIFTQLIMDTPLLKTLSGSVERPATKSLKKTFTELLTAERDLHKFYNTVLPRMFGSGEKCIDIVNKLLENPSRIPQHFQPSIGSEVSDGGALDGGTLQKIVQNNTPRMIQLLEIFKEYLDHGYDHTLTSRTTPIGERTAKYNSGQHKHGGGLLEDGVGGNSNPSASSPSDNSSKHTKVGAQDSDDVGRASSSQLLLNGRRQGSL